MAKYFIVKDSGKVQSVEQVTNGSTFEVLYPAAVGTQRKWQKYYILQDNGTGAIHIISDSWFNIKGFESSCSWHQEKMAKILFLLDNGTVAIDIISD